MVLLMSRSIFIVSIKLCRALSHPLDCCILRKDASTCAQHFCSSSSLSHCRYVTLSIRTRSLVGIRSLCIASITVNIKLCYFTFAGRVLSSMLSKNNRSLILTHWLLLTKSLSMRKIDVRQVSETLVISSSLSAATTKSRQESHKQRLLGLL